MITFNTITRLTPPDFLNFTQLNPDLICELNPNGSITLKRDDYKPAIKKLRLQLHHEVLDWSKENDTGFVAERNTCFVFKTGAVRQPTIAWLRTYKKENTIENFIEAVPDFVVEFLTEHDNMDSLKRKMREYITNGTAMAWLIDVEGEKIYIFRASCMESETGLTEKISGEDVLPNFVFN